MDEKNSKLESILLCLIYVGFGIIFLLPLLVFDGFYFPFVTFKNFSFRLIVEIQVLLWFFLALKNKTFLPRFSGPHFSVFIFIFIIASADFFGIDPFKSYLGNFERMDGFINHLHLLAYMIMTASVLKTKKQWAYLAHFSLAVAICVGLVGCKELIQYPDLLIGSTIGNSSYLAIYILFHLFIAALLYSYAYKKFKKITYLYLSSILFFLVIFYNTGSRGSFLGFFFGSFVALILGGNSKIQKMNIKKFLGLVVGGLFVCGIILWNCKDTAFVKNSNTLSRITTVNSKSSGPSSISSSSLRFRLWTIAMKGIRERPITGWGQENFEYVFDRYYDPALGDVEYWYDRSHNVVLDWILAGGILGGLSYLFIFISALCFLWKKPKNKNDGKDEFTHITKAILSGVIAAYFIHNFFMFDYLISYLFFFSLLAFISRNPHHYGYISKFQRNGKLILIAVLVVLMGCSFYFVNLPGIKSAHGILEALKLTQFKKNQEAFVKINEAIKLNSFGTREIKEQLGGVAISIYNDDKIEMKNRIQYLRYALEELKEAADEKPYALKKSLVYMGLADQLNDRKIEEIFSDMLKISPNRQLIYTDMINYYLKNNQFAKAQALAKVSYGINPDIHRAQSIYALSALLNKEIELSDKLLLNLPLESYVENNRFIQGYTALNRPDKVIEHLKKMIILNPKDQINYLKLGIYFSEMGKDEEATRVFAKARKLSIKK